MAMLVAAIWIGLLVMLCNDAYQQQHDKKRKPVKRRRRR